MFSRILNSARNIITFNKPVQDLESGKKSPGHRSLKGPPKSTPAKRPPARKSTMVTTRRQSGALLSSQPESVATSENDDTPYELLSTSARKRRRAQLSEKAKAAGEDEIGTPTMKRRKLPVRNKNGDSPQVVHSNIAVVIPAMEPEEHTPEQAPAEPTPKPTPKKAKGTPPKKEAAPVVELVEEEEIVEEETTAASEPEEVVEDVIVVQSPAKTPTDSNKTADATPPTVDKSPAKPETETPVAAPKHKRFSDDDDTIVVTAPPPAAEEVEDQEKAEQEEEEEDESSSDEAPEEVGAQTAQSKAKDLAREAAKAIEVKAATERLKRKERDAQLKLQAEAAKKRKHTADDDDVDESVTIDESSITVSQPLASKVKFNRSNLPDLLPEEFLNDDEVEDVVEPEEEEEVPRKSKKIKFVYPEEKKVKDRKLGSTLYRVVSTKKEGLPPKASKSALAVKAALMGGRRGQVRKAVGGGFFGGKRRK